MMTSEELKDFLDIKAQQYEKPEFVIDDPIQLSKRFETKADQEIIGFLVATISWGNRKSIIRSGEQLIRIMGDSPLEYVLQYSGQKPTFTHRTFNPVDLDFFLRALKKCYTEVGSLEHWFTASPVIPGTKGRIVQFRNHFLQTPHETRSEKHLSNPLKNSACKRINMFLRWMVRPSNRGVDLGIWPSIPVAELLVPLDVHTSKQARLLNLIERKQDDWKSLEELMTNLRMLDPSDPAKYDFALFGIGVNGEI